MAVSPGPGCQMHAMHHAEDCVLFKGQQLQSDPALIGGRCWRFGVKPIDHLHSPEYPVTSGRLISHGVGQDLVSDTPLQHFQASLNVVIHSAQISGKKLRPGLRPIRDAPLGVQGLGPPQFRGLEG